MANARTITRGAMTLIGALAQGEAPEAGWSQEALRRLNMLVASWNAQFLTSTAIQRTVVPLTANQQTYTIGTGGDINIPRPLSLETVGLLLAGQGTPVAVTSITSASSVATATVTGHGFDTGDSVYIEGATQAAYNGLVPITVTGLNTFTYPISGSPASPATGTITVNTQSVNTVEIPRVVYTDAMWQSNQIKNLSNTLFTGVYYTPTQPLGLVSLWPVPNTADNQLVLYTRQQFTAFADLTTDYTFVDLPGYEEALEYNLALRMATPFGRDLPGDVREMASTSLALIKRGNYRLNDLQLDPVWARSRRSLYNINTGNG